MRYASRLLRGRVVAIMLGLAACLASSGQRAAGQDVQVPLRNDLDKTIFVEVRASRPYAPGAAQQFRIPPKGTQVATLRSPDPFYLKVQDLRGNQGVSESIELKGYIQKNPNGVLTIDALFGAPDGQRGRLLLAKWSLRPNRGPDADADVGGSLDPPQDQP